MSLCIRSRGIRDIDSNCAYCPDCATGLVGPIFNKALEAVKSHFLSIGPVVECVQCRLCFKELTTYRSISECSLCKHEIRRRGITLETLLITRVPYMIHIAGGRQT